METSVTRIEISGESEAADSGLHLSDKGATGRSLSEECCSECEECECGDSDEEGFFHRGRKGKKGINIVLFFATYDRSPSTY